jgi:hypothetical protein
MSGSNPKITITNTGSTNTAGLELTLDGAEDATIRPQAAAPKQVKLSAAALAEFTKAIEAAGPLHALPASHCMKSASFGSSLYVSRGDDRSPDLSCPEQSDARTAAIKKQAEDLLQAAQKAGGVRTTRRRIIE